jgi:hypothetical protein
MPRSKNLYLMWSWKRHRHVPTKKEANRLMRVWRAWYERKGWKVTGTASDGYRAYHPDHNVSDYSRHDWTQAYPYAHAIALRDLTDAQVLRLSEAA